jgi:ankyrin repeat protein
MTSNRFLLAQIHIEALSRQDNRRDVRRTLLKLPEEINSTYDEAMARIRDQNSQKVKRAEQVLSWICYAFRPLKVKELQYALAIEPGDIVIDEEAVPDEDDLVAVCAGLVTVDMESKVIRLVHYTVQEYFDAKREYYFPDAHTDISRACITYLSMDCCSKTPCSEPDLLEANPLLNYAARFWMRHLRGEPERPNESLVLDFFRRPLNLNFSIQAWFSLNGIGFAFDGWFHGLWVAAHTGLEHVTQRLIEDNADIGSKNGSSMETALHAAARQGDERILILLLEAGAAVNAKERHGDTALHFAAVAGHLAAVNVLIANNADIEVTNSENRTPLHEAAFRGKKNVVRTFLDRGANATSRDSLGETALHRAAHNKKRTVIKLLLEKGAGLEKRDLKGRTALHCAVESGRELLARLLLTEGANIEAKDGRGATPLRKAVSCNDEDMAKLRLEAGADPNAKGYKGFSLLRVAGLSHRRREWRYGRKLEGTMETLLLRYGARPEAEFDGLPFRWDEDECLWLDVQSVSHTLVRHSSF